MYASPQGYICIYTSVYTDVSRESGCTSKGASHFHQSKNFLDVMVYLSSFYTSSDNNRLWEQINVHVMNTSLARRCT